MKPLKLGSVSRQKSGQRKRKRPTAEQKRRTAEMERMKKLIKHLNTWGVTGRLREHEEGRAVEVPITQANIRGMNWMAGHYRVPLRAHLIRGLRRGVEEHEDRYGDEMKPFVIDIVRGKPPKGVKGHPGHEKAFIIRPA